MLGELKRGVEARFLGREVEPRESIIVFMHPMVENEIHVFVLEYADCWNGYLCSKQTTDSCSLRWREMIFNGSVRAAWRKEQCSVSRERLEEMLFSLLILRFKIVFPSFYNWQEFSFSFRPFDSLISTLATETNPTSPNATLFLLSLSQQLWPNLSLLQLRSSSEKYPGD